MPGLWRFLIGRFFYSDAVNTVIVVMSVVVVKTMGVSEATANVILLRLTVVAIIMSFVWGWLVDRNGPKRTLVWVLVSWAVGLDPRVASRSASGRRGWPRSWSPARSSAAASAASRSRIGC